MRHRFEQRKAEAFIDRRKNEDVGVAINRLQLCRAEIVEMMHVASGEARHEFFGVPADATDNDQRSVVLVFPFQIFKCVE